MKPSKLYPQPHPVVSPYGDDIIDTGIEFLLNKDPGRNAENWQLHIESLKIDSRTHQNMINQGAAEWRIHAECPETLWRELIPIDPTKQSVIEIPVNLVDGKVSFFPCLVATQDQNSVHFDRLHQDYDGCDFNLLAGELLAFGKLYHFDAYREYNPIENIPSILRIEKHETEEVYPMKVDFDDNTQIILTLSQRDYENYSQLRQRNEVSATLFSCVVAPVLLQAANFIHSLKGEDLEEAKKQLWIRSLIAKLDDTNPEWNASSSSVFLAVQQLLEKPVELSLAETIQLLS